jgi:hypothetical protein
MRAVGFAVLAGLAALALGGDALAGFRHGPPEKQCYMSGAAYRQGDYCYTSCAPTAACELEACIANGQWMEVGPCRQRDCHKVC